MPAAPLVRNIFVLLKTSLFCWVIFKIVKIQECKVSYLFIFWGHRTGEVNPFPTDLPVEGEGAFFGNESFFF